MVSFSLFKARFAVVLGLVGFGVALEGSTALGSDWLEMGQPEWKPEAHEILRLTRVNPETGEQGSVDVAAEAGPLPAFRVYLWWMINRKHSLRLLYAPLEVRGSFTSARDVLFDEVNFLAGQPLDALYRFNSYRVSYIYHFDPVGRFAFRLGFTAKIRDAETSLSGRGPGAPSGGLTDLGFVPLLNFGVRYSITEKIYLDFDIDGSWAPQARAIDAALKAG